MVINLLQPDNALIFERGNRNKPLNEFFPSKNYHINCSYIHFERFFSLCVCVCLVRKKIVLEVSAGFKDETFTFPFVKDKCAVNNFEINV